MPFQTVFKRYELKYLITKAQKEILLQHINKYMALDKYGRSTVNNIYFDTESYLLIRRSIEKPVYKEKLRIRCYSANPETVFVELKKKYKHIVYKRRIALDETTAIKWLSNQEHAHINSQISKEIDYFIKYYGTLHPTLFLSYCREAYYAKDGSDFRVTFDDTVACRQTDFSFSSSAECIPVLPENMVLMELKCSGGIPIWMAKLLSHNRIYKTSFSKYGTAYRNFIFPQIKNIKENINA